MTRLMISDDYTLRREGLKQLLALSPELQVVAEADSSPEVLERLRPGGIDLLMLNMGIPSATEEYLLACIQQTYPKLPILILSMQNEPVIAQRMLKAGARGYLTKDCDYKTLLTAIRRIVAGGYFLETRLAQQIAFRASGVAPRNAHDAITMRQLQILRLIAQGHNIMHIANELTISHKTVSTHKARLMTKMGFTSTASIVRYAMEQGLA